MPDAAPRKTLPYKRSHFATQLPVDYLYSPSHCWLGPEEGEVWRVGLTKFATRMLGELVDFGFESELGARVSVGQTVGWIEGFKAISDIYCVVEGTFMGANARLKENLGSVSKDGYGQGWLYRVRGKPDPGCLDVNAYKTLLDQTIDRILAQQRKEQAE